MTSVCAPMMTGDRKLHWPTWATLALGAIIVTSIVTVAAAINDIW